MLQGVVNNFPEQETIKQGCAVLRHLTMTDDMVKMHNLRVIFNRGEWFESINTGEYIQLYVNGELMMSDTQMERYTNQDFIYHAHGDVMIAGLGVGMILENLIPLCDKGVVNKIVVYEKYQDVIDLVAHRYDKRLPLEVRLADIMEYKPPKEEKYDTLYFDIWPVISDDNLNDIRILHNRWKTHKNKGAWMNSWMADFLRKRRKALGW